jgi:hypothetical protein
MDENLVHGNAFRYRDYVIAGFNRDKPYDQFIREQLAGDLLASPPALLPDGGSDQLERLVATGFLSIGPKMLAEDDPVKMEMDIVDEQIDTIGRTFMGLTLGCARCHDHKYDPVRTEDYYSLAGIFKSTQTMDNFKVVARWHEQPLGSKEAIARQQAHEQQVAAKKGEISARTEQANTAFLREARRRVADYLLAATEVRRQSALGRELRSVMTGGGQRAEGGGQKSEGRAQKSEVSDQKDQKSEVTDQESPKEGNSAAAHDQKSGATGVLVIEAEEFTRGNVKKDFVGYGDKIGVIYNQGELPNFAEYDVTVIETAAPPRADRDANREPAANSDEVPSEISNLKSQISDHSPTSDHPRSKPDGTGSFAAGFVIRPAAAYQIELRFAAADSRPVKLLINGELVKADATAQTTGTWYPDTQTWVAEGVFRLRPGKNTVRLERAGPFPHFDKLALVPLQSADAVNSVRKTPEQLAAEQNLTLDILQQWVRHLDATQKDPDSVLYGWHAFTTLPAPAAPPGLFQDLKSSALRGLAARYQELFDQADRAWQELKATKADAKELPDAAQESLRQVLYDPKGPFALPPKPEAYYPAETTAELKRQRDALAALEKSCTPLPEAMAVYEGKAQDLRVHLRGSHLTLGAEVRRQFPRILAGTEQTPIDEQQSGRLQLAEWLTRPDHPLTARVMVNRLWRWHFGAGLVRTPDNFGRLGDRPTHPQLLDWLARRFVESGWSVKALHRLILLSSTYQMSTAHDANAAQLDPENRLLWRMNRRRLEAEAIRDAVLATSGQLDRTVGGSLLDGKDRAYVPGYPNSTYDKYDFKRRSVYLPVLRSLVYDVFQTFDFADPSVSNGDRPTTTVAPQALFMLNSALVAAQARHMARALLARSDLDESGRVHTAYLRAFGRPPLQDETTRSLEFVRRFGAAADSQTIEPTERRTRAWQSLCRAMMSSSEFIHVE